MEIAIIKCPMIFLSFYFLHHIHRFYIYIYIYIYISQVKISQGYSYVLTGQVKSQDNGEHLLVRRGGHAAPTKLWPRQITPPTREDVSQCASLNNQPSGATFRGGVTKQSLEIDSTPLPTKRSKKWLVYIVLHVISTSTSQGILLVYYIML